MERFFALLTKEKIKNHEPDFPQSLSSYTVYKKLGQLFFLIYLLTCLNKDSSVLLKLFEQVNKLSIKPMVLTFYKYYAYAHNSCNRMKFINRIK